MSEFSIALGVTNVFAMPFAISYEAHDEDWKGPSLKLHFLCFCIAFEWRND
jgi:hypothetical protein